MKLTDGNFGKSRKVEKTRKTQITDCREAGTREGKCETWKRARLELK
jgi:hypothetical protein